MDLTRRRAEGCSNYDNIPKAHQRNGLLEHKNSGSGQRAYNSRHTSSYRSLTGRNPRRTIDIVYIDNQTDVAFGGFMKTLI